MAAVPLVTFTVTAHAGGARELRPVLAATAVLAATTITVNTTDDILPVNGSDGKCTLREAIIAANTDTASGIVSGECVAGSGTDTITFDIAAAGPHVIQLTTALPDLSSNMNISGPSGVSVTVRGEGAADPYRIFTITFGASVSISRLTITNGMTRGADNPGGNGGDALGGGIINFGTLQIANSTISGNTATGGTGSNNGGHSFGGGIFNQSGTLQITDSTISGNSAIGGTGNNGGFVGAQAVGGGIFNNTGTLQITDSTISGNSATGAAGSGSGGGGRSFGAGIASVAFNGTFRIINSTISGNSGTGGAGGSNFGGFAKGGGIYNSGSTFQIINSTISGNSATVGTGSSGSSEFGKGGGIYNEVGGKMTLTNSTITMNAANGISGNGTVGEGGGIYDNNINGSLSIGNTIVAQNTVMPTATSGPDVFFNSSPIFTSLGYNLIGKNDGAATKFPAGNPNANQDRVGTSGAPINPLLGPLASNGGPTQTHRLLPNSPAIDKGKNLATDANNNPILTDQRGLPRPVDLPDATYPNAVGGDASDIGAYELQSATTQSGTPSLVVNTAADHDDGGANACTTGDCTLREAIIAANANADTSTITFDIAGPGSHTIQLTTALPDLSTNLNIEGPADKSVTVQGEGAADPYRIFTINPGQTIRLSRLTISNGRANSGGGIYNNHGSLTVSDCTLSGNSASGAGGAILNDGAFAGSAALTITNSTLSGNSASNGGGIYNSGFDTGSAALTMANSTLSGNSATLYGGGIYNNTTNGVGSVGLTNVTITNNRADADDDGNGSGGALFNDAPGPGGVLLRNTIAAANFKGTGNTPDDLPAFISSSSSFNLIGTGGASGLTNGANNNQVNVSDPRLGPLADNGGPTRTHALLPGSPAIEAGSNSFITNPPFSGPPFTDQRGAGFSRIADGPDADTTATTDIGAYETHASVEDITDKVTLEDTPLSFSFNVGDAGLITSVTATSANQGFLPNANLNVSGSGSTRTLQITPAANLSGAVLITVTVTSGAESASDTFLLTVNAVNDAPTLNTVSDVITQEDVPFQTISLTGISAGGGESQTLAITATSNNTGLIPNPLINYTSPNATGVLTLFPVADQNGSALITVTVRDDAGTANSGVDTVVRTFNVTVNAVNDAPVNIVPGAQTFADPALTFSAANSNLISISDVDAGDAAIQVTLSATNGTLTLASTADLSFTTGDGTADPGMTFTGSIASINSALSGLIFTPNPGVEGAASVQITTNDQGNSGAGGALSDTDTIPITVNRSIQFSLANYTVSEADGRATITVTRTGSTANPAKVDYVTSDLAGLNNCSVMTGDASARCDYTAVGATLLFLPGESSKTFNVPIINDVYVEPAETLTLTLSNPTGGSVLGTPSVATLTITDNDNSPATFNPVDTREFFIRQLYLDTLNREPEPSGLTAWLDRLNTCPRPGETLQNCDEIEVASAFFRSPEFFDRSYFIYKVYEVALGRQPQYDEYERDVRRVTGFLTPEELELRKQEFLAEFVTRQEFRDKYDSINDAIGFVSMLSQTAGVTPSIEHQMADDLGNGRKNRAQVLRAYIDSPEVSQRFFNKAFVVIAYFAFLRRNPDINYLHWIEVLNTTGDYREMIRGFTQSAEYRFRFGPM